MPSCSSVSGAQAVSFDPANKLAPVGFETEDVRCRDREPGLCSEAASSLNHFRLVFLPVVFGIREQREQSPTGWQHKRLTRHTVDAGVTAIPSASRNMRS